MHVLGSWGLYHKSTSRKVLLPCIMFEQSFAHFKIVGGNLCSSFCEACFRLDFFEDDNQYHLAMQEASVNNSAASLHSLFAVILT